MLNLFIALSFKVSDTLNFNTLIIEILISYIPFTFTLFTILLSSSIFVAEKNDIFT
jgi:hypothetical protein